MKKLFALCLTVVMAVSLSFSAFAALGSFVSSPSGNSAPVLVSGENTSEDCVAEIIITAYADRDKMTEDARQKIEEAYSKIVGTQDVSSLSAAIAEAANKRGLNPAELAVSDLFDISSTNCEGHSAHGHFDITLKAETLKNFAFLLHYHGGEWHLVDNATVTNNGENLEFDANEFSPFAIVVYTGEAPVEPAPANNTLKIVIIAAVVAIAIGAAAVVAFNFIKKKKI